MRVETTTDWKIRSLTWMGNLLFQMVRRLLYAAEASPKRAVRAVSVGFCHVIWEPKYLEQVVVGTGSHDLNTILLPSCPGWMRRSLLDMFKVSPYAIASCVLEKRGKHLCLCITSSSPSSSGEFAVCLPSVRRISGRKVSTYTALYSLFWILALTFALNVSFFQAKKTRRLWCTRLEVLNRMTSNLVWMNLSWSHKLTPGSAQPATHFF